MSNISTISPNHFVLVACGSFSPVTLMHMRMMECARERILETFPNAKVIGIMSPVNDAYGKKGLARSRDRIEMCRLATMDSDWICIDSWESEQSTNQETIKVLDHVRQKFSVCRIMLVCGADLLQSFNTPGVWAHDDVKRILNYGIVVISRPGTNIGEIVNNNVLLCGQKDKIFVYLNPHINNLSSTYIRTLVKEKKSIKYLVPNEVNDYIRDNNLFI